ncbi:TPPP family protein [Apis mellifera caucasica]|nr:TPPP family protein [Apis mellifera caucasica]KAG9431932.1 TPPP family protein [Apis mellifera carnica]
MMDDFFLAKKDEPEVIPLEEMFKAYCEMDPVSSDLNVQLIPLSQSDKWLISARILDMVTLTTTDTGLTFFKFRKRALSFEEYLIYLKDLAESKNLDFEDMKYKMQICGKPRKN